MDRMNHPHEERTVSSRGPAAPPRGVVGIDTGGTFTDVVAWAEGTCFHCKLPSDPRDPGAVVLAGLEAAAGALDLPVDDLELLHGTTLGTNLLLEGKGGRAALVTTAGFGDLLAIARQNRSHLHDLAPLSAPVPIVERLRFEVPERTLSNGEILISPSRGDLANLRRVLDAEGIEAVAVCFLHSYRNPANEEAVAAVLRDGAYFVCTSSEVLPVYREYERFTATALNARIAPALQHHLGKLRWRKEGAMTWVMQSTGGLTSVQRAGRYPLCTVLSGPAAGVTAARGLARSLGLTQALSLDLGGTSTDLALVEETLVLSGDLRVGDLPLGSTAVDLTTLALGGGSIVNLDPGGLPRVGPESAGADPGPACSGRGELLTLTDLDVLTGRLPASTYLGGKTTLDCDRAARLLEVLAGRAGLSPLAMANGYQELVETSIRNALVRTSAARGLDPAGLPLIAFGGAGGLHAVPVAEALGATTVVFPALGGLFSALGLLQAEVTAELAHTVLLNPARIGQEQIGRLLSLLEERLRGELVADETLHGAEAGCRYERFLDMQYAGQGHTLTVPHSRTYLQHFHLEHRKRHGFSLPDRQVEIVNLRVRAIAPPRSTGLPFAARPVPLATPPAQTRVFSNGQWIEHLCRDRATLDRGESLAGPALVVDATTSILIPQGWRGRSDESGHLLVEAR